MTDEEKPLSPAMVSALRVVARMKGDSGFAWDLVLNEGSRDDRFAPQAEADLQQGWKPAGR